MISASRPAPRGPGSFSSIALDPAGAARLIAPEIALSVSVVAILIPPSFSRPRCRHDGGYAGSMVLAMSPFASANHRIKALGDALHFLAFPRLFWGYHGTTQHATKVIGHELGADGALICFHI